MVPSWQINSLPHPRCKIRTQLSEVLLTSKKKNLRLSETDEENNRTFLASCLSTFLFSFRDQREQGSDEKGRRGTGEGESAWWQASWEMCFSRVHIKCTWKTTAPQRIVGYPPGPSGEAMTDVYICHFGV